MDWVPHAVELAPEGGEPAGWLYFLHGILGSGANWRTIARRLVAARPDWGAVLVDLRMHGRSQGAPPPHTVDAAAEDLVRLARSVGVPVRGVIGHSFGGKVALALRGKLELDETWVLDATPGARPDGRRGDPDSPVLVLDHLRALPGEFADRAAFVAALTGRGLSQALADWLAMNLEPVGGAYRLRLDLEAIDALLSDYYRQDLWGALAPGAGDVHVVVAGRSRAVDHEDRARLAALPVALHVIEEAGHWLHMEAPDRLLALISAELGAPSPPSCRPA